MGGDGDPGGPRRDPPDGRAGGGDGGRELLDRVLPSSSTDRPLKKLSSSSSSGKDASASGSNSSARPLPSTSGECVCQPFPVQCVSVFPAPVKSHSVRLLGSSPCFGPGGSLGNGKIVS